MYLLPKPQKMELKSGFLQKKAFIIKNSCQDPRIEKALLKLPCCEEGTLLEIVDRCYDGEDYVLEIEENKITLTGNSPAGIFCRSHSIQSTSPSVKTWAALER